MNGPTGSSLLCAVCLSLLVTLEAAAGTDAQTFRALLEHARAHEKTGDWPAAMRELEKIRAKPNLTDDQRVQVLQRVAVAAIETGQRDRQVAAIEALQARPVSASTIRALAAIAGRMARHDLPSAERIMRDALEKADANEAQKLDILQRVLVLHLRHSKYRVYKPMMEKILKKADDNSLRLNAWTLAQFAVWAVKAHDFGSAEACYRRAVTLRPGHMTWYLSVAELAIRRGDGHAAQADLQKVIDNQACEAPQRYVARIVQLAATSRDAAAFRQRIPQADEEFAAEAFSEEQRFKLLREASARLFAAARYDAVRALEAETAAMLRPEQKKTFVCRYVKDPPRSADSWARSPLLGDARYRETRFEKYGLVRDTLGCELARLKGAEAAPPAISKEGYDVSVHLVYDAFGVHLYGHFPDPEARQIKQGLMDGGSLELYFQPGKDHAYHQWFFELPGTDDPHLVNWDTPHRHYRYTYDYLEKDATVTDRAIGAYSFIPWLLVYDKLPSKSNQWRFSMQRWSEGGSVTLGGAVHELGRAMTLDFEMSPAQLLAVKREIVVGAFAKYRHAKEDALTWADPALGHPAFFQREVQPLLERLDKAGESVTDKLSDAGVESLFAEVVPDWMEFGTVVAGLRANYLKERLFLRTDESGAGR